VVLAVDQIVGGRHYVDEPLDATPAEQVGRKLLARNLSDIAAMGARPSFGLVAVALPPNRDVDWLNRFLDGILALAREFGVAIVGGDLAAAPHDQVASLTILGEVTRGNLCRRQGAQPGDLFYVTGAFGGAFESGHHLTFQPRCAEGAWLAQNGYVHGMIDVSDGLWLDALRICRASAVGLRLDPDRVPRRSRGVSAAEALSDGEDYELAFGVPPALAQELEHAWPFAGVPLKAVGEFTAAERPEVTGMDGEPLPFDRRPGFDHLA
jgi:thiamine-monophosphate kinase